MSETQKSTLAKQAAERIVAALNRADELGGELRDTIQEKMATDARYIKARKAVAKLLGKDWQSPAEVAARERAAEAARKAAAATASAPTAAAKAAAAATHGFGDPSIKAQIFGKKSDPWTGRAITILERNKVDFDNVDLEEPENESKLVPLANETKQHTVPFIYLRGQFIGGFNALAEIERLGQLEYALMSAEEREKVPPHARFEIVPRPNTDEVVPAESAPGQ
ncbi:MAG: glutaredoxin [Deltaproteobacteria bacterium]|nr:glutaredoxin [Deltaproteobacteria bacterium]